MPKDKNYNQRGFTLIELMLVVAIISALGALVVPRFTVSQEAARTARVQADLRTIETAIVMFEVDVGKLPASIDDLTSAYPPGGDITYGPYLKTKPVPPDGTVRVDGKPGVPATAYSIATEGENKGRALLNGTYTVEKIK